VAAKLALLPAQPFLDDKELSYEFPNTDITTKSCQFVDNSDDFSTEDPIKGEILIYLFSHRFGSTLYVNIYSLLKCNFDVKPFFWMK